MSGRVAVLHNPRSFFPPDLHQAVDGAVELIWVLVDDSGEDRLIRELMRRLGSVIEITSTDLDGAAATLAAAAPDGILTFVDRYLVLTAELAERLDLRFHTPEVAARITNKSRQRQALAAAGVPGPKFWSLPAEMTSEELAQLAREISYPAVLKPAHGSGSLGIHEVAGPKELQSARVVGTDHVVEEYLFDDPASDPRFASYVSVESVVSDGRISHAAISGRFPLGTAFRETGDFIPAAVSAATARQVLDLATASIRALEITTGVLHIEIKLTPDGPRLIEVNGRLGGRPPFELKSVSDVNLFQIACRLALGQSIYLPELARCRQIGYFRAVQPPIDAARVLEVRGVREIALSERVDSAIINRGPGQPVDARMGSNGQVVTVVGRADNLDDLAETIKMIDGTVEIDYEPR